MVGGLPGYRQQDAVHGLPLQLSPEEVTLCVARGWAELYSLDGDKKASASLGMTRDSIISAPPQPPSKPKPVVSKTWGSKPKLTHNAKRQKSGNNNQHEPWRALLKQRRVETKLVDALDGTEISETRRDVRNESNERSEPSCSVAETTNQQPKSVSGTNHKQCHWSYPRTESQKRRFCVFAALHKRGVTLTSGAKFGCDYLAYPGDPAAYHASFTVRVMDGGRGGDGGGAEIDQSVAEMDDERPSSDAPASSSENSFSDDYSISLLSLVAATRMAHGARKHCVLAAAVRKTNGMDDSNVKEFKEKVLSDAQANSLKILKQWDVSFVTVTPDVEQSSQRRGRV